MSFCPCPWYVREPEMDECQTEMTTREALKLMTNLLERHTRKDNKTILVNSLKGL